MFPFAKVLVKLSCLLVPGKDDSESEMHCKFIDDGNEQAGELDENFREREHNNGRDNIKNYMRYGYLRHRVGRQLLYPLDIGSEQGDKNKYARADNIEEQVDNCGTL